MVFTIKDFNLRLIFGKFVSFLKFYFDLILLIFFLFNCLDYIKYIHESKVVFEQPSLSETWWRWPDADGWTIEGQIPWFNEDDEFDVTKNVKTYSTQVLKFPKKPNQQQSSEKLILFEHFPIEQVQLTTDPNICGGRCKVEYGKQSLYDKADAIIFSLPFPQLLPKRRFPSQLYVWLLQESPSTSFYSDKDGNFGSFKRFDNGFNLTMSYRRDSDIYAPYNTTLKVYEAVKNEFAKPEDILQLKTKLAAWVSGKCALTRGGSARTAVMLKIIQLGLKVDVFGRCVDNPLPGVWWDLPKYLKQYKFYFAFENSLHCRDYVTEKVWYNALTSGAVPVILGATKQDLEAVLPKNSFISVENFKNVKELVDYLIFLDKNDEEYLKYFKWRFDKVKVELPRRNNHGQPWLNSNLTNTCQLCYMLHQDDKHEEEFGTRPVRLVESLNEWWYLKETKTCLTPYTKLQHSLGEHYGHMIRRFMKYNSDLSKKLQILLLNFICFIFGFTYQLIVWKRYRVIEKLFMRFKLTN